MHMIIKMDSLIGFVLTRFGGFRFRWDISLHIKSLLLHWPICLYWGRPTLSLSCEIQYGHCWHTWRQNRPSTQSHTYILMELFSNHLKSWSYTADEVHGVKLWSWTWNLEAKKQTSLGHKLFTTISPAYFSPFFT